MYAIVASEADAQAAALAARWADEPARVLTPRDLSHPGWRHHVGTAGEEWAVIGRERVRGDDLRGVITRLPLVQEHDLGHIAAADREYVAAEMTAFLLSWLTGLKCPVLNRPTVTSLMGKNFSRERWLVLAGRAGLTVARGARGALGSDVERPRFGGAATVIGDRWVGDVDDALGEGAVRLAAIAGVSLCTVRFDGGDGGAGFIDADLFTDLGDPRVADALLEHLDRSEPGGDA